MLTIPFFTYSSYTQDLTLDGVPVTLKFQWNAREEAWQMSIYDADKALLLAGVKLVPNYDLFQNYRHLAIPQGALLALDQTGNNDRIGYEDFTNDRAVALVYVTEAERAAV